MALTKSAWDSSPSLAYGDGEFDSIDLHYAYSDKEYSGMTPVTPLESSVELVDFGGEGYCETIVEKLRIVTGFKTSYNINQQYKTVGNGINTGRKIPNRIPTINYDK